MYPFERFSESAKRVLTLAQEEAERSHHSYIGTEHILLGLLRDEDGTAARVLNGLGVELGAVRTIIDSVLGANYRIVIQEIIPTSRVKVVIELAFEEARRLGVTHVGSEHLLLALLIEGEGIAAHVLQDLGAGLDAVRKALGAEGAPDEGAARERAPGPSRRGPAGGSAVFGRAVTARFGARSEGGPLSLPASSGHQDIDAAASRLAAEQHTAVGIEHLLPAALDADPLAGRILAALGVSEDQIAEARRIATPPAGLIEQRRAYAERAAEVARTHGWSWIAHPTARPSKASGIPDVDEVLRLRDELEVAEKRWRAGEDVRPEGGAGGA
ncbi:MAG: Clp protease N-terminal domain-containing protein [Candidatus Dormibacteria bacterium]|jgi:hypothetical protein